MKNYFILLLISCIFLFSFKGKHKDKEHGEETLIQMKSSSFKVLPSYLSKHDIVFLSPTQLEAEGFPMGNGDLGGMIWNHENGIEIQINKNDLWSEPDPRENDFSSLRHCGRLKIDFGAPVFSWIHMSDFEGRLSLADGEVTYRANTAYSKTNISTWLSHGKNVWVIECENLPENKFMKDGLISTISLERIGSRSFSGWYGGNFPKQVDVAIGNTITQVQGKDIILEETGAGVNFVVACRILDNESLPSKISSHRIELKNTNKKFTVLVSVVTIKESSNPKDAAIALLDEAEQTTVQQLKKEKNEWYNSFWSKSFVKLGDDYLENIYYLRRYLMGAGSQGKYPINFNGGLWRWNRDVLNWVIPHHWNTQQQYWGLCAQNDCDLMSPYLNTYFNMIPFAEELAKEKGATSDAILITEAHDFDGRQVSKNWGSMKHNYIPASQIAALFWDYYDYTRDIQFLKDKAYVFMTKAANFYLDKLEWDNNKKEYFLLASMQESEGIQYVKNPITDRNSIEALLKNCITAATILNTDHDKIKKWKYVLENLWERRIEHFDDIGDAIVPADEYFTDKRYSPLVWMNGGSIAFPSGVIGIDEKNTALGKAVANVVKCREHTNAHYPTPIVAARIGMGDEALTYLLNGIKIHQMYPQGLMTNVTGYPDNIYNLKSVHDLLDGAYRIRSHAFFQCGLEPISNYATTVNEMMLQSNEGKIRVFPAVPKAWDNTPLAFKLLARGAFLVLSERNDKNEIIQVSIKSLEGNTCKLQNPWPDQEVSVYLMDTKHQIKNKIIDSDVISFNTKPGTEYIICRASDKPVLQKSIYSGEPNKAPKRLGDKILGKESGWDMGPDY
ncbi:glycosyl hydrolase family 95 catalytic domain-containing protein [Mariniphaga sp.]|uniref:glycosyl hydrolase family 95 catalytic domain-containing protein n=1 Tax=Mariniphaga sp. TaxID=1954475 RepID=UPI00356172FF